MTDIQAYNQAVENPELKAVCEMLIELFDSGLAGTTSKVWHGHPVWFIKDNPIVGYSVTKKGTVNVLFWSGQAFTEPGLTPEGSFKAAEIKYAQVSDIDEAKLNAWLSESCRTMYNYNDIRKNRGELWLIDPADL